MLAYAKSWTKNATGFLHTKAALVAQLSVQTHSQLLQALTRSCKPTLPIQSHIQTVWLRKIAARSKILSCDVKTARNQQWCSQTDIYTALMSGTLVCKIAPRESILQTAAAANYSVLNQCKLIRKLLPWNWYKLLIGITWSMVKVMPRRNEHSQVLQWRDKTWMDLLRWRWIRLDELLALEGMEWLFSWLPSGTQILTREKFRWCRNEREVEI